MVGGIKFQFQYNRISGSSLAIQIPYSSFFSLPQVLLRSTSYQLPISNLLGRASPSLIVFTEMAASILLSNQFSLSHPRRSRGPHLLSKSTRPINSRFLYVPSCSRQTALKFLVRTSIRDTSSEEKTTITPPLIGEDSAVFDLAEQKVQSWVYFTAILGVVLFVLNVAWLDSSNGLGLGSAFVDSVSGLSESHEVRSAHSNLHFCII